jgi:ribosome-interacting GTPase 1
VRVAILVKGDEIGEIGDLLLIDGEILKSYNLEDELRGVDILVAKSLPSPLIKKLREKGIIFFKASSFKEIEGLDFKPLLKEGKIKRGAGCQRRFT